MDAPNLIVVIYFRENFCLANIAKINWLLNYMSQLRRLWCLSHRTAQASCASAQSRQSFRCLHIWSMEIDEWVRQTRGPVVQKMLTWHLVLVYSLMLLYTYIAPRQGQTTPWGQMLMSTESPYHFAHLLELLKQSLWSMTFFMILYKPQDRGRQPIRVKMLMPTERPYHFDHLLQV